VIVTLFPRSTAESSAGNRFFASATLYWPIEALRSELAIYVAIEARRVAPGEMSRRLSGS
jgi:hypothetical protein